MAERIDNIHIIYNEKKSGVKEFISHIKDIFEKRGIKITTGEKIETPEIIIAIGGDGTLLKAAYFVGRKEIPIMGINMGNLGFLTEVPASETEAAIENLINGRYRIEKRAILEMECNGKKDYALNDHVISQTRDMRMVSLDIFADQDFITNVFADGLIVSTPTGSTAYSLACGGPILIPDVKGIVLTPISPHSLSMRPIVISDDKTIKVKTLTDAMVVSDGQRKISIKKGDEVSIKVADFSLRLIRIGKRNFYEIIRDKLGWGKGNKR